MGATRNWRARQRHASLVLVLALVPMLTFMGHWPSMVPVPGTDLYVYVPLAGHPADHSEDGDAHHEHSKHCHGEAASCSDAPAAAGVALALMHSMAGLSGAVALFFLGILATAVQPSSRSLTPELRPPRALAVWQSRPSVA